MGSLAERLRAYKEVIATHPEHMDHLPGFVDLAFAETRKRTNNLVELPDGETIDIQYLPEWGPDRVAVFRRFLTAQWTPSQLAANSLSA